MDYKKIDDYIDANLSQSLDELSALCRIPSVAAQNTGLEEAADFLKTALEKRGFTTEIILTPGSPIVYAELDNQADTTLLIYNHYDVQPAEPFDLWTSPPFEPETRDGKLFARGVSDDKGHITSRFLAIDSYLSAYEKLPVNLKFIIEGEEEIGSIHLPDYIRNNPEKLAADACIWEFGGVDHRDVPFQNLGLRGICYVELSVKTANIDSHSGLSGSIFPNAAWRLVWALSTLKNQDEKILIDHYYDNIVGPSEVDLKLIADLPEVADEYKARYGIKGFLKGLTAGPELRRTAVFEPTCTICGLTSGYQGEGSKTVLPAKASAKVDFRLVPNQTPEEVLDLLRKHLDKHGFQDIEIEFMGGGPAGKVDPMDPFVQLVNQAAEEVYGIPPVIDPMNGGSGPNYPFIEYLKVPIVMSGIGHPGSRAHAPDENIRIDLYTLGTRHFTRILGAYEK